MTNVTTAIDALMQVANGGNAIDSQEALDAALGSYDTSLVLPLATAIKLVIDYAEANPGLALPQGVADTSALVAQLSTVQAYLQQVQQAAPETYQEAQAAMLADDQVIPSGTGSADIPFADTYYFKSTEGQVAGDRMILSADGSGKLYQWDTSGEFSWSQNDNGIGLTYTGGGLVTVGFECNENGCFDVEHHRTHTQIKWLARGEKTDQMLVQHTSFIHYPNGEFGDSGPVTSDAKVFQVVKNAGVLAAEPMLEQGVSYSIPTPQVSSGIEDKHDWSDAFYRSAFSLTLNDADSATLQVPIMSGDGTMAMFDVDVDYSFSDTGHLLLSAEGEQGSVSLDYAFLRQEQPPEVNVLVDDTTESHMVAASALFLQKEVDKWTPQTAPGIYDLGWDFFSHIQYIWVEVNADGTSLTVNIYDQNGDGTITEDEIFLTPGLWQINDSGSLSIRRYRYNRSLTGNSAYCTPESYDPALSDTCVLYHEREWNLHQVVGDDYYMQHIHRFFNDRYAEDLGDAYLQNLHVLSAGYIDNRSWHKTETRPYPISATVASVPQATKSTGPSSVFTLQELERRQIVAEVAREERLVNR